MILDAPCRLCVGSEYHLRYGSQLSTDISVTDGQSAELPYSTARTTLREFPELLTANTTSHASAKILQPLDQHALPLGVAGIRGEFGMESAVAAAIEIHRPMFSDFRHVLGLQDMAKG